jgi:hypothetical protein
MPNVGGKRADPKGVRERTRKGTTHTWEFRSWVFQSEDNPTGKKRPIKPSAKQIASLIYLCRRLKDSYHIHLIVSVYQSGHYPHTYP